jgi:hypothetical protein
MRFCSAHTISSGRQTLSLGRTNNLLGFDGVIHVGLVAGFFSSGLFYSRRRVRHVAGAFYVEVMYGMV